MMGLFSGEKKEKERERERILDDHNDEIIFTREKKREREREIGRERVTSIVWRRHSGNPTIGHPVT